MDARRYARGTRVRGVAGNTRAFQALVTGSSPVGRSSTRPGGLCAIRLLRYVFRSENRGAGTISCNLFADHEPRQREIENFWLDALGLPPSSLCKSIVNRYSKYSQKKRKNKLPYGTCRISVHSTEIAHTIYGSIQELAGFERPEWLDAPG
jgi:hypothetical protein